MEDGPPKFSQDFTCPDLLKSKKNFYVYRAITYFGAAFHPLLLVNLMLLG